MENLPPPPPVIPRNVKPEVVATVPPKHSIMVRLRAGGPTGRRIALSTNHFKVSVKNTDAVFYQYCALITYEDKRPVEGIRIGRKLMDKLFQTYANELSGKKFVYDGEKALYTVGPLLSNKLEFTVVLEDSFAKSEIGQSSKTDKRMKRCSTRSKSINIEISYAAKIPLNSIARALQGAQIDNTQDALRVLTSSYGIQQLR